MMEDRYPYPGQYYEQNRGINLLFIAGTQIHKVGGLHVNHFITAHGWLGSGDYYQVSKIVLICICMHYITSPSKLFRMSAITPHTASRLDEIRTVLEMVKGHLISNLISITLFSISSICFHFHNRGSDFSFSLSPKSTLRWNFCATKRDIVKIHQGIQSKLHRVCILVMF